MSQALTSTLTSDVDYGPSITQVKAIIVVQSSNDGKTVDATHSIYDGQVLIWDGLSSIDPPFMADGWWAKFKQKTVIVAKAGFRGAMTGVVGAACAVSTSLTMGTTGITSWASLGTATPLGVAAVLAVGSGCGALTCATWDALAPSD